MPFKFNSSIYNSDTELVELWDSVEKGTEFLLGFSCAEKPQQDLSLLWMSLGLRFTFEIQVQPLDFRENKHVKSPRPKAT